ITYPAAGGLWSLAGGVAGPSPRVGVVFRFCLFLLVGEAFNWPCALKVTQSLLPPKDRPLANGIFNSGAAVGALLAPLIVTLVTVYYGWRAAFVITGALGGVWVVGWLWYTRGSGDELKGTALPFGTALRLTGRILGRRAFWMLAVSAIVINSANFY